MTSTRWAGSVALLAITLAVTAVAGTAGADPSSSGPTAAEISGTTDVAAHPEFAARRATKTIDATPAV